MVTSSSELPDRRIARLDVDQIHAMLEAGILREGEPVELSDRVLVGKDRSADASLAYERTTKLALDARFGIPQCVIVDLQDSTVEIYEQPSPAEACYRATSFRRAGEAVALRLGEAEHLEVDASRSLP